MGHRGKTHWLDLKSCPVPLAALSHPRRGDAFALSIPCPELAVLGWCKEGAGTKARLALTPHPRLGRCSSPRCQHPGEALGCPPMSCRTPEVAWSGVWVSNGSGSSPRQGCECCWCRQGPWQEWKPNARCTGQRRASGGRGGRQSSAPHLPLPVPGLPSRDPITRGPLSPPQYPPSGLSTCRLGWRRRRGGSEGPFCVGMNGSLFPSGGLPPPACQAATLPTPSSTSPPGRPGLLCLAPQGSGHPEMLRVRSPLPPSPSAK